MTESLDAGSPGGVPRAAATRPGAGPTGITEQQALELHARAQELQSEGRHNEALPGLQLAAEYFAAAEGSQSPDLANVLTDWSESLLALCRYYEAEEKARQGKEILYSIRDLLDPDTRGTMAPRAAIVWGRSLRELGRYEEAAGPLLEAIREAEQYFGADDPEVSGFLNEYGILCKYWGRFDEGERYYLRGLRVLEERFGKEAPETASLYHNLGGLEHARGEFTKGEPFARTAFEIRRRVLGADHADAMADAVAWGGLLDGLGRHAESIPIYRRALEFYEQRFGPDHFEVAATLNNLGMALAAQGEIAEGREQVARCLAIKRKLFAADHPEVRLTEANLRALGG
jgi:tetratricopeptide (TPR) repeat protein